MSQQQQPSSLIEDAHQGVTSAAAQATIDRYRAFVQAKNAPIAHMQYSPFTKQPTTHSNAIHTAATPTTTAHRSNTLHEEVVPASSSRIASPRDTSLKRSPLDDVPHGVLHTKPGGTAWSLDLPAEWVKTSDSRGGSKRGSRIGSLATSRKSSFNFGDSAHKSLLSSRRTSTNRGGFETTQSIWAATMHHQPLSHRGSLSHRDLSEKYTHGSSQQEVSGAERSKRLSLTKPYLKAHSSEAKYGVTYGSRPIGEFASTNNSTFAPTSFNKAKRSSMPPLQNKRGVGLLDTFTGRRGSMSHGGAQPNLRAMSLRARSKSLPTDSLFLAYSSCALPTVMTSSLAAMPIPSQPAIPVSVARRYSILAGEGLAEHHAHLTQEQAETELKDTEVVNVDPTNVEGIDTSSVLDTSHLHDLVTLEDVESASEQEDDDDTADELDQVEEMIQRDGFLSNLAKQHSTHAGTASTQVTPMGSPVGGSTAPLLDFPMASPVATPENQNDAEANYQLPAVATNSILPGGRSRSLIHTSHRGGLTIAAPARDQLATPDYTPLTSPTNLSNAVFKQALMTRRMSDVVAKDISKKLRQLQRQMAQDRDDESTDDGLPTRSPTDGTEITMAPIAAN